MKHFLCALLFCLPTLCANAQTQQADTLQSVRKDSVFVLEHVYFKTDSHQVTPESEAALIRLYDFLVANPKVKIAIEGHVCCVHAKDAFDEDTMEPLLSQNRAKAIYNYLTGKGIDPARLSWQGFGHTRPIIADEKTADDAAKNKRVEIRIVE